MKDPLSLFRRLSAGGACNARRCLALAAALGAPLIFGVQAANADTQIFRDVLRPHGVARSQAQKFADGRACGLTAENTFRNAAAFRRCMRARGWVLDHVVEDTPSTAPTPATYIDPETGMECHDVGIAAVCDPPSGTVYYYNKHGRPCRRTGLVAICT